MPEADETWNSVQHLIVCLMAAEHEGDVYAGVINPYGDEKIIRQLRLGHALYNFGASFVVPGSAEILPELIAAMAARLEAPYRGTRIDAIRLGRIAELIEEANGCHLVWT
ncbi:MAG: hypothetical protein GF341_04750 [candidate division Zixibacteria bacterium]|nr:hypothetical protein [candidate division Zixibacteria bacterium]